LEGTVPLSEHEQRVLEQIERSLYADDPKFAATVRGIDPRIQQRRRYIRAGVLACAGAAVVVAGFVVGHSQIAVGGFAAIFLCALYAIGVWRHGIDRNQRQSARGERRRGWRPPSRHRSLPRNAARDTPRDKPEEKRGMMQRFEDRWNRRRETYGN
jgi:hypothetical protein